MDFYCAGHSITAILLRALIGSIAEIAVHNIFIFTCTVLQDFGAVGVCSGLRQWLRATLVCVFFFFHSSEQIKSGSFCAGRLVVYKGTGYITWFSFFSPHGYTNLYRVDDRRKQSVCRWRQHTETHQKPYQRIVYSSTQFIYCITDIVGRELCSFDCLIIRGNADVVSMSALRWKCPYLCWLVFFLCGSALLRLILYFCFLFCAEQLEFTAAKCNTLTNVDECLLNERFRLPSG